MNGQGNAMQELQRLASINGRTIVRAGKTNSQGKQLFITADYPCGDDAATGTAEELLTWERGYIDAIRAEKDRRQR